MIGYLKKNDYIWLVFLLFIFVVPLERLGSLSFGGFTIRLSQMLIVLLSSIYGCLLIYRKNGEVDLSYPIVAYIIFLCWSLFSLVGAQEKLRGLQIIIFNCFMVLVPLVMVWQLPTKDRLLMAGRVILIVGVLVSLFGLFQFAGDIVGLPQSVTGLSDRYIKEVIGLPRIQSTFIEPLYLANFMIIPMMIAVFYGIGGLITKNRGSLLLLALMFFSTIILTFSKGGIAVAIALIIGVLLFYFRAIFSIKNIPYFIFLVILVSSLTFSLSRVAQRTIDIEKIMNRAVSVMTGGSIRERQDASSSALQAFSESPIYGIGTGNFGPYFSGYPTQPPDYGWPIVNNQFLEVLAENGIVGLLLFIFFLLSILYRSAYCFVLSHDDFIKTALVATSFAFVGVLVQYLTFSTLYIMHIWVLIGFMLSIQNVAIKQYHADK